MLQTGRMLHKRYTIQQIAEHGGDYLVYAAEDQRTGKNVLVKETIFQSSSFARQFEFEARLLATLRHPSLPVVIDYFVDSEGHYLVMEHVPGQSLSAFLASQPNKRLTEHTARMIIDPLIDVLAYLHNHEPPIIHRNIHPDHIRLHRQIYLVNFGIAKAYSPTEMTTIGALSVNPGFSPIEQYGATSTDARSDLYAFGATIYLMLTGVKTTPALQRVPVDPLKPVCSLNAEISASMERVYIDCSKYKWRIATRILPVYSGIWQPLTVERARRLHPGCL
ncbi:MAG: serine/threonine protein kinase [Chloroflexaceae bacterium]|nr:serine/threonine protein kinase [Chloroflexaceae bacterium]